MHVSLNLLQILHVPISKYLKHVPPYTSKCLLILYVAIFSLASHRLKSSPTPFPTSIFPYSEARILIAPQPPLQDSLSFCSPTIKSFLLWLKLAGGRFCRDSAKMMQTLNPYTTARTAEIMARYRPIAPKPESPVANAGDNSPNSMPQSIRKSPYLMHVWPHLQARPTRTRKRGRTALAPPAVKRSRTCLQGLSTPYQVTASPAKTLALQGFAHDPNGLPQLAFLPNLVPLKCGLDTPVATPSNSVTLPFLPASSPLPVGTEPPTGKLELNGTESGECDGGIDLNKAVEVPEELDFLPQLQGPTRSAVIAPQAIRPVGSSITVGRISKDPCGRNAAKQVVKKPEEVEKEVESETLPAVVSDSNNKVRLTNSAYNEMLGQPECCWLDYMSCGGGSNGGACKRIGGEVVLDFVDSCVPLSSNGFTCWVRIEWGKNGKKSVVNAFCDAIRLTCESKDYLFEWRFHIREASESASNV